MFDEDISTQEECDRVYILTFKNAQFHGLLRPVQTGKFAWNCAPDVITESKTTSITQFRGCTCCRALQAVCDGCESVSSCLLKLPCRCSTQWIAQLIFDSEPSSQARPLRQSGFLFGDSAPCKTTGKTMTIAKPSMSITRYLELRIHTWSKFPRFDPLHFISSLSALLFLIFRRFPTSTLSRKTTQLQQKIMN